MAQAQENARKLRCNNCGAETKDDPNYIRTGKRVGGWFGCDLQWTEYLIDGHKWGVCDDYVAIGHCDPPLFRLTVKGLSSKRLGDLTNLLIEKGFATIQDFAEKTDLEREVTQ